MLSPSAMQINICRLRRQAKGGGILEVVWMTSQRSYENVCNLAYPHVSWYANHLADKLADDVASAAAAEDICTAELR